METVEIEIPVEEAMHITNEYEADAKEIKCALECLDEYGFQDSDMYWELDAIRSDKEAKAEQIRGQIEEQTGKEEGNSNSLGELFS